MVWLGVALLTAARCTDARTEGFGRGSMPNALVRMPAALRPCRRAVVDMTVTAGQSVRRRATRELDVVLEARGSGWLVRVVPHSGPAPEVDYAGIATPPYRSVSPLLLSTDFGFRAQDAVGWTPREFRFAADVRVFAAFLPVFRSISRASHPSAGDEAALGRLVAGSPEGAIEIIDARLVPGTADQSRAAAAVASHFSTTAHTLEQPPGGRGSPLGAILGLTVRVSLDLADGFAAAPGVGTTAGPCSTR